MRTLTKEVEDPCYPTGYVRPQAGGEATVSGTGDAQACTQLIRERLLASSENAAPGRYTAELPLRGTFAATENFFYVRNGLHLPLDGNLESMKKAAATGCSTPMSPSEEKENDMKAGKANPSEPNACFGLCFQVALLEALHAPKESVQIVRQINGGDVDWALGAALKHFIDSGMGDVMNAQSDPVSLALRALGVLLVGLVVLGAIRYFLRLRYCKTLQHQSMQAVATTIGAKDPKISAAE
jgi:hypothetical protein